MIYGIVFGFGMVQGHLFDFFIVFDRQTDLFGDHRDRRRDLFIGRIDHIISVVKLDFDRIETIAGRTGLPLVLHGGSGLSDSDFRTAVQRGICKVNIFTDIDKAGKAGIEEGLAAGAASMMALIPYEIEAMKKVVRNKMELFGSVGRVSMQTE